MFPCGSGSVLQQIQVCQDMFRGITAIATKKTGEALANVSKNLIKPQPQAVPNTVAPFPKTIGNPPVPKTLVKPQPPVPKTVAPAPKTIGNPPVPKNLVKPQPLVPKTVAPAPRTNSNGPVPHINPVEFNKNLRAWEKELSKKSEDTKKLFEKKEQERKFETSQFMDWSFFNTIPPRKPQ